MQNYINNVTDENTDEEWSSFCSSCKSVLKSICSVGETFSLNEIIDESTKEKDVETRIEKYKNIVETSNGIKKKPNEHIPNNYVERNDFFNNNTCEKREINEKNRDQSDSHRSKKVKCIELSNKADTYSSDRNKVVPCKIIHRNSRKITHDRNMKQKKNYGSLKAKMLLYSAKKHTQSNDRFLGSDVISSIKSQSVRQNILDHRKNILEIAQSILHLR
ncbi:uncharacterized protein LOC143346511 [Colletes latitarsis]|uniref:uncharacterized protein LOC143346511 n=1 Tax=Colletes latitarsis TaxID=2605962 RepID=UPI0040356D30